MTTITLVLVSHSWKGKTTLTVKGRYPSRDAAKQAEKKLRTCRVGGYSNDRTDYRVLGPRQLAALVAEINEERAVRRRGAAVKAAATRKRNGKKPSRRSCSPSSEGCRRGAAGTVTASRLTRSSALRRTSGAWSGRIGHSTWTVVMPTTCTGGSSEEDLVLAGEARSAVPARSGDRPRHQGAAPLRGHSRGERSSVLPTGHGRRCAVLHASGLSAMGAEAGGSRPTRRCHVTLRGGTKKL
jgi:hypothetical protein